MITIIGLFFLIDHFQSRQVDAQTAGEPVSRLSIADRERAHRANNLGVAHLERFDHEEAAKEFRKALAIDPGFKLAQINLAIALFNAQQIEPAVLEAEKANKLAPDLPQTQYILGLLARNQNRTDEALAHFQRVLAKDPDDVGSNVNVGQIHTQQRRYPDAIGAFRRAYDAEPYNSTAIYNLATTLIRNDQREEGQKLIEKFQLLRQSGAATSIGQNYLEQGRYAEALVSTGAEPELVDETPPELTFRSSDIGLREPPRRRGGRRPNVGPNMGERSQEVAALFDFDNDGDLDLVQMGASRAVRLFRNEKGRMVGVTAAAKGAAKPEGIDVFGIVPGDFDNDGFEDLLFFGRGGPGLFRGDGKGGFTDVTASANLALIAGAYRSGCFADTDHDGDLDIFLGAYGPATGAASKQNSGSKLLRNNGDGTFTDISATAGINSRGRVVAVVPTDYDNRRDMDLLVLSHAQDPALFQNLRNGTFRDVGREAGLVGADKWTTAAAGDFNKDTFVDFFFGREGKPGAFAVSDGRGKFALRDAPSGTENAFASQFADFDNDGLLDLAVTSDKGLVISRNLGDNWSPAVVKAGSDVRAGNTIRGLREFFSGDLDQDGDLDILAFGGNNVLQFFRNTGAEGNRSTIVTLKGRVSNRTGAGAKVDMRSGSLSQKLESYAASPMPAPSEIHFGLGKREGPDVVRVVWPSGVVQAEVNLGRDPGPLAAARRFSIEELDRKPSSCPYLFTWNGEKFEFVTDFLGGGEMGNWKENGAYHFPDSDEFVRITSDQLKPKEGKYEIRVANELEEVLFLDHLKLIAVEHDDRTQIYPNEGLAIPTAGKKIIYTTSSEQPPLSAVDGEGRDVLPKIKEIDRNFYDSFRPLNIRGYAEPHSLILNLDNKKGHMGRTLLLLTGWTDYAFSSDNVAASQSGKSLLFPKLQVRNKKGAWQTVIESIGISVGRPQTVVVDLTGKFLTDSREVRIVTNVKTYWDRIAVDTSEQQAFTALPVKPLRSDLRERGFSDERSLAGMIVPTYERVADDARWKYFSGRFTRTGDVEELLEHIDDVFVISRTGDELMLSFAALPPPSVGRRYTFLLYADGYSKEMDINSGSPDAVHPLPFKGMTKYPYGPEELFPVTARKQRLYDEYTTRIEKRRLPRLETALLR